MATPAPPLPPDVQAQMQSPEIAQSVFAQQGLDQQQGKPGPEMLQQVLMKVQELDRWATDVKMMLDQYDPALAVFLQPIAQAGLDLGKALQERAQRSGMARGSPVMPPQPPQNPTAGPPNPAGV